MLCLQRKLPVIALAAKVGKHNLALQQLQCQADGGLTDGTPKVQRLAEMTAGQTLQQLRCSTDGLTDAPLQLCKLGKVKVALTLLVRQLAATLPP